LEEVCRGATADDMAAGQETLLTFVRGECGPGTGEVAGNEWRQEPRESGWHLRVVSAGHRAC